MCVCAASIMCQSVPQASGNVLFAAGSPVNGEASSPPPTTNDNRPPGDNLDTILFQLRQVTRERDELRKRLALASPGTTFDDCRCESRPRLPSRRFAATLFISLMSMNLPAVMIDVLFA